jgi:putative transposase
VRQTLGVSERRACRTLGQHRSTQRKVPRGRPDEDRLTADIIELATQYGRYGYRPVTALLNQAGWHVNHKRVERIWQREGLKVPPKQKKRSRLWLNDGSCIRLRPERPNHVWSYDFVQDRTHDGRPYRILVILDEFTFFGRNRLSFSIQSDLEDLVLPEPLPQLLIQHGGLVSQHSALICAVSQFRADGVDESSNVGRRLCRGRDSLVLDPIPKIRFLSLQPFDGVAQLAMFSSNARQALVLQPGEQMEGRETTVTHRGVQGDGPACVR